jgi:hypothetical protein
MAHLRQHCIGRIPPPIDTRQISGGSALNGLTAAWAFYFTPLQFLHNKRKGTSLQS